MRGAIVMGVTLAAAPAWADEFDIRMPTGAGYAYSGITRAPVASVWQGGAIDAAHITHRLSVQLVTDAVINSQPELADDNPVSSFTIVDVGTGLFYVTDGDVGFGFDVTAGLTFDAQQLVGGGFGIRAYVYPFYLRIERALSRDAEPFIVLAQSSIALWAMARVDWTANGRGGTVGFGASFDLMRLFFVPYVRFISEKFR
jgi:hypothetical protein